MGLEPIDINPERDTYYIVYSDAAKTTFLFSPLANTGELTLKGGVFFNSYESFAAYNAELAALEQPIFEVNPFSEYVDPSTDPPE